MENKKNRRKIKKAFDGLTTDILDHYKDYEVVDKVSVKEQVDRFKSLNNTLKIYDTKMQKEEIKNTLDNLMTDILDNYDDYLPKHKELVKQEMISYEMLNAKLDKYDKEKEIKEKKAFWHVLCQAFGIQK